MWHLVRWPNYLFDRFVRIQDQEVLKRKYVCSSYWYELFVSKIVLRKSMFSYHLWVVTTQFLCERRGWLTAQNDLCDVISLNICCCLRDLAPCWQRNWWQLLMTLDTISRQVICYDVRRDVVIYSTADRVYGVSVFSVVKSLNSWLYLKNRFDSVLNYVLPSR